MFKCITSERTDVTSFIIKMQWPTFYIHIVVFARNCHFDQVTFKILSLSLFDVFFSIVL